MPFVLFLLFGSIFLLMCMGSKSNSIRRMNNFPSCRYQEEFLLFYEKFFEYRADSSRADPVGDALEDARYELWQQGHLPSSFIAYGMSDWRQRPIARRARFTTGIKIRVIPFYSDLLQMRARDNQMGDHSMYGAYLEYRGKDIIFNQEKWDAYCAEMDRRFEALWDKYQPPNDYLTVSMLDRLDAHNVLFQGGTLCYYHAMQQWFAYIEGKNLGIVQPSAAHESMAGWHGIVKEYYPDSNCTVYRFSDSIYDKKRRAFEDGARGYTHMPFHVGNPTTISIARFNNQCIKEWKERFGEFKL